MNSVAVTCTALLGLLLFGLGFAVSMARFKFKVLIGSPSDPTSFMYKLVRAHANTAEYVPFLAILFLYLGSHNPTDRTLLVMELTTAARFIFVVGMLAFKSLNAPNPVRFVGAAGTYAGGISLAATMLFGG